MKKILKKTLSLFLALLLTFSVASFAFAADYDDLYTAITAQEAEQIAIKYLAYQKQTSIVSETLYSYTPAYEVLTTIVLDNDRPINFVAYIDKYSGDVLYRSAKYYISPVTGTLTKEEAAQLAMTSFGARKDKCVVLTNEITTNDKGNLSYHIIFCEDVFERNECTIDSETGDIDNIKIGKPSNIFDRLVLMIRVFIAKNNLLSFIKR